MTKTEIHDRTKHEYDKRYREKELFPRYPSENIIRLHNIFLRANLPQGRVLDFGCGAGCNLVFFLEKGYDAFGVDITDQVLPLVEANLEYRNLEKELAKQVKIVAPNSNRLPFDDGFFDLIVSHNALYCIASEQGLRDMIAEFHRCLRPGGYIFVTMMGTRHYWVADHTKRINENGGCEIEIDEPGHRLHGTKEAVYAIKDEEHLKQIFNKFETINVGYYDQSLFDQKNCFHWLYTGRKSEK